MQHERFYHTFENKYTFFWVKEVSDLAYEFCSCVGIAVDQVLTKYGQLVQ